MASLETEQLRSVFVVSSGRTGTNAIAHYLGECFEDVTALHEPKPSRNLRVLSTARLANRKTPEQLADALSRSRQSLCKSLSTSVYVESNPYLFGFVDVLAQVFTEPLLLHIVRDPRTMIRSALNFNSQRGIKWFFSRFVPNWILKPELLEVSPEKTWSRMSHVERIAWYWVTVNSHIQEMCKHFPDRSRRIKYEDLFLPDGSGIRDIAAWIGLKEKPDLLDNMLRERFNASRGKEIGSWEKWPEEDRQTVYRYCGKLMEEYGYEADRE